MATERVSHGLHGKVAVIEIGDGTRRNALGARDWHVLAGLVAWLPTEPGVAAIVVRGRGDTFSAGSDMNDWVDASFEEVEQTFRDMETCFQAIERSSVPVIAAVEDIAAGAGCQLALACDLVVLSEAARIGMPVARFGIQASEAFVARVSRRAGKAMAADLYLTGRLLTAEEAINVGLVTRVVSAGTAFATATTIATQIAAAPAGAISAAKSALSQVEPARVAAGADAATTAGPTVAYNDFVEAIRDFLLSRRPT